MLATRRPLAPIMGSDLRVMLRLPKALKGPAFPPLRKPVAPGCALQGSANLKMGCRTLGRMMASKLLAGKCLSWISRLILWQLSPQGILGRQVRVFPALISGRVCLSPFRIHLRDLN